MYETASVPKAAILMANGIDPLELRPGAAPGRFFFVFDGSDGRVAELLHAHHARTLRMVTEDLFNALQRARDMLGVARRAAEAA